MYHNLFHKNYILILWRKWSNLVDLCLSRFSLVILKGNQLDYDVSDFAFIDAPDNGKFQIFLDFLIFEINIQQSK